MDYLLRRVWPHRHFREREKGRYDDKNSKFRDLLDPAPDLGKSLCMLYTRDMYCITGLWSNPQNEHISLARFQMPVSRDRHIRKYKNQFLTTFETHVLA